MSVSQCAHPSALRVPACPDRVGVVNLMFSAVCRLLFTLSLEGQSLCALFRTPFLCFQQLAASFTKTPGGGGGVRLQVRTGPYRSGDFITRHFPPFPLLS